MQLFEGNRHSFGTCSLKLAAHATHAVSSCPGIGSTAPGFAIVLSASRNESSQEINESTQSPHGERDDCCWLHG